MEETWGFWIDITYVCFHRCRHCCVQASAEGPSIPWERLKELLEQINARGKPYGIALTGGDIFRYTDQGKCLGDILGLAMSLPGAKDKNHLAYLENFQAYSENLYLKTEKGDIGEKGLVTDKLEEIMKKERPDFCLNCGPEGMAREAIKIERQYVNQENIYSSIEFLTKCGIGLCGSCATPKGYRSCLDGTFLKNNQLGF